MRVLIAPDCFGGTLSAVQAADAIATGWLRGAPADVITHRPLSDGGPGFVDVLASVLDGQLVDVTVPDPLGRPTVASFLMVGDTAYIESAHATGLHLLAADERDIGRTTTYGVGVLLAAAVEAGARRLVVGLGGSSTNDGGVGMLAALGVLPRDATGAMLPHGGAALLDLDRLDRLEGSLSLHGAEVVLASDVDNPLVGEHGASAVFGPQKGASPRDVELLDAALTRFAEVAVRDLPTAPADLATAPGGGAAGGLGAALFTLGGHCESGITLVCTAVDLDGALDSSDLVITGEGSFDSQSLHGKVAIGVAAAAAERGLPCLVLAGQVKLDSAAMAGAGVRAAYSVAEYAGSVEEAMREPAARLAELAERVSAEWSPGLRPEGEVGIRT